jgi:UDP-N-acetylmuramyl tripeptide synthase
MKNIKTTLFGALAAICSAAATTPGVIGTIGTIGASLFTFLLGHSAQDAKK